MRSVPDVNCMVVLLAAGANPNLRDLVSKYKNRIPYSTVSMITNDNTVGWNDCLNVYN